ncbi:unnamed protein product [Choristocarpus tenellus]
MLVEQAHDLISVHSPDDRAIFQFASGAYQRILGIDPKELVGLQLVQLIHVADTARVIEQLHMVLLYGKLVQVKYRIRHNHQRMQSVETSFRMASSKLIAFTRVIGDGDHAGFPDRSMELPTPPSLSVSGQEREELGRGISIKTTGNSNGMGGGGGGGRSSGVVGGMESGGFGSGGLSRTRSGGTVC